jgi:hypothetical protein
MSITLPSLPVVRSRICRSFQKVDAKVNNIEQQQDLHALNNASMSLILL